MTTTENTVIEPDTANIDKIILGNTTIYLVGTAHVSETSVALTEKVIREVKPTAVAVELCESRYKTIMDPDSWRKTDIITVIRTGRAPVLMAQLVLGAFQKKLANKLNIKPGAEMIKAIQVAEEIGAEIVLADREVRTTLKRVWHFMRYRSVLKLIPETVGMLVKQQDINTDEIEKLKSKALIDEVLEDFTKSFPEIKSSLITERDQYLAGKLQQYKGESIVAIVGAGHVPGIKREIQKVQDLAKLDEIPKKTLLSKCLSWAMPAAILGLFVGGFLIGGGETGLSIISTWIIFTGISAAIGAMLAMAHPLSILSALFSAPITTIHPFIASGMVASLVQTFVKKPQVSDFETVVDDISTLKGWYKNRLAHIFLILVLTNACGSIGLISVFLKGTFSFLTH